MAFLRQGFGNRWNYWLQKLNVWYWFWMGKVITTVLLSCLLSRRCAVVVVSCSSRVLDGTGVEKLSVNLRLVRSWYDASSGVKVFHLLDRQTLPLSRDIISPGWHPHHSCNLTFGCTAITNATEDSWGEAASSNTCDSIIAKTSDPYYFFLTKWCFVVPIWIFNHHFYFAFLGHCFLCFVVLIFVILNLLLYLLILVEQKPKHLV